jgi:hypothetical protein
MIQWSHRTMHQESIPSIAPSKCFASSPRTHLLCIPTIRLAFLLARKFVVAIRHIRWRSTLPGRWRQGIEGSTTVWWRGEHRTPTHFLPSAPTTAPVSLANCTFFYTDIGILVLWIPTMWIRGQIHCLLFHVLFFKTPDEIFKSRAWHIPFSLALTLKTINCCKSRLKILTTHGLYRLHMRESY